MDAMRLDRRRTGLVSVAVAVLLFHATAGCSWIGVTRAPPRPVDPVPPVQCTRSVAAPVGDTILGVLAIATGVALTSFGNKPVCVGSCPGDQGAIWAGVGAIAAGVTLGVSAGFGYAWTADCRELEEMQDRCIAGVEASCQALREDPAEEADEKP
jgi:hypothetical protein